MSFQLSRGFRNPLLRRVRRHSALSTLFRTPSEMQPTNLISPSQQIQSTQGDSPGVVQATMGGIQSVASPLPSQPVGFLTPEAPGTRTAQVQQNGPTSSTSSLGVRPAVPAPSPVNPIRSTESPVVADSNPVTPPAETAVVPDTRTPEVETDTSLTDSVWQRLQTIFKRHQSPPVPEGVAAGEAPASNAHQDADQLPSPSGEVISESASTPAREAAAPAQTPPSVQRTPSSAARIQRSLKPGSLSRSVVQQQRESPGESDLISPPLRPDGVEIPSSSETVEDTLPRQSSPGTTSRIQEKTPVMPQQRSDIGSGIVETTPASAATIATQITAPEPGGAPTLVQRSPVPGTGESLGYQPEEMQGPQGITDAALPSSSTPAGIQRMIEPTFSQDRSPMNQANGMDAPPVDTQPRDIVTSTEEPVSMETGDIAVGAETTGATTPLQNVWQVERIIPRSPVPAPAPVQAPPAIQRDEDSTGSGLHRNIARLLDSVAAGGPTSSSIEVVSPRHPRPVPQQVSRRAQKPTIMREPAASQDRAQTVVSAQERTSPHAEDIVDTAIGPLPADLWTLIDEPVPPTVRRRTNQTEGETSFTGSTATSRQTQPVSRASTVQRTSTETVQDLIPGRESSLSTSSFMPERPQPFRAPSESPAPQAPSRIQRVAEQYGGNTQISDTEQRSSTTSLDTDASGQEQQQEDAPAEGGEVDIDALARKVYAEVKRKLTVEWERLRSRF